MWDTGIHRKGVDTGGSIAPADVWLIDMSRTDNNLQFSVGRLSKLAFLFLEVICSLKFRVARVAGQFLEGANVTSRLLIKVTSPSLETVFSREV